MLRFLAFFLFPPPDTPCAGPPARDPRPGPPSAGHSPRAQTCTFKGPGLQKHHQNSTRRLPEREREREKERKWRREREKKREILGPPPSDPTLRAPTLRCPTLRAPTLRTPTLGALTFSRSFPHPFGPPTLRPPAPFERRPSGPPLFLSLGPYVPYFYHLLICFFCVFLIVSISCFFGEGKFQCFSFFSQKIVFF